MEILVIVVVFAFVSSLIWLIRNWNAKGPTDLWEDGDFESRRSPGNRVGISHPSVPIPKPNGR